MKLIIFENMPVEEIRRAYKQLIEDGFLICNRRPEVIELTDTERIKLGDMEIERPVELISKEDMPQTASSKTLKKKGLKPITKKKPKTKKVKNSQIPRKKVKYTEEIIDRVKEVINEKSNPEIRDLLSSEFGINVSVPSVANMLWTRDIKRNKITPKQEEETEEPIEIVTPKMKHQAELAKQKRKGMSEETIKIIEEKYMEKTDEELRELIADKVGSFHPTDKIKAYRESNGMARPMGWSSEGFVDYSGDGDE